MNHRDAKTRVTVSLSLHEAEALDKAMRDLPVIAPYLFESWFPGSEAKVARRAGDKLHNAIVRRQGDE